jgi:hypothetical protein
MMQHKFQKIIHFNRVIDVFDTLRYDSIAAYGRRVLTVIVNDKSLQLPLVLIVTHCKASYMIAVNGYRKRLSFSCVIYRVRSFTTVGD